VGGLLQIAPGELVSYEQVARAVGTAVGANPVALLIPCHRVIRKVGDLGGYRWGLTRKRALVGREAAMRLVSSDAALSAV
jgi:AraC family transcriptional regulator, regulatory protein of adaptative response / methylated-DNA-[protein]-cysteine methyltransferase